MDCKECYGTGEVPDSYDLRKNKGDPCHYCNGTGKLKRIIISGPNFNGQGNAITLVYMKELDGLLYNYIVNGWSIKYEDIDDELDKQKDE